MAAPLVVRERVDLHAAEIGLTPRRLVGMTLAVGLTLIFLLGMAGGIMKAAQGNLIQLQPQTFYALLTLHGAGMISTVVLLTAIALWYVLQEQLGLKPEVLLFGVVAIVWGLLAAAVAVLIGGFGPAWTFLYPLPFLGTWPAWSTGLFFFGVLFVGIGFAVFCLDLMAGIIRTYGGVLNGLAWDTWIPALRRKDGKVAPPQVIAATMVAIDGLITVAAGSVLVIALLAHWFSPRFPIDPLWIKNLTYFFGHTIANLAIYVSAGVIYAVLPAYTGRTWHTNKVYALSWAISLIFVPWAWPHHLYMDFVQAPWLQIGGEASTYIATIPATVVTIFGSLLLVYRSRMRWRLGSTMFMAGILGWLVGGIAAMLDATIPFNEVLHNTLWVPAHFHTYLLGGVFLFVLGFASYFIGERPVEGPWLKSIEWCFFTGLVGFLLMFYAGGIEGVPRREAVQPAPGPILAEIATGFVVLLLIGLVAMLIEFWLRARSSAAVERERSA
jgi:cytochrome c oxidase subunit 1